MKLISFTTALILACGMANATSAPVTDTQRQASVQEPIWSLTIVARAGIHTSPHLMIKSACDAAVRSLREVNSGFHMVAHCTNVQTGQIWPHLQ